MTTEAESIRKLLEHLVMELVDRPEEAEVTAFCSPDSQIVTLTVRTGEGEQGKVIGKQGSHAQAIRLLLEAVSSKHKMRMILEIADNDLRRRRSNASQNLG